MRTGGVPTRGPQSHLDVIGGRRDRAGLDRDPADREMRIAVQREDPRHPGQRARGDRVDRAAGHQLLGRLEDQPDAHRQLGRRGQRHRRPQQHRGVRVVPAGVGDARHQRRIGRTGALVERQRVHVRTQRHPRSVVGPEVAQQTCAAGQHLGVQARVGQLRRNELSGGELLAAQLGMLVQMAAPPHQVVVVGGQPARGGVLQRAHDVRLLCSSSTRSRSALFSASATTVRASMIEPSTTALSALGPTAAAANPG